MAGRELEPYAWTCDMQAGLGWVQHNFKHEELDLRGKSIKIRCGGWSRGESLIVEPGMSCWGDYLLITLVGHWIKVH